MHGEAQRRGPEGLTREQIRHLADHVDPQVQSVGEEIANTLSHGLGLLLALAAVPILIVVAMIPSVAGLGTGQVAFVQVFGRYGDDETLLACSLAFSTGLIVMRAGMGLLFAGEFTREALRATREAEAEDEAAAGGGEDLA